MSVTRRDFGRRFRRGVFGRSTAKPDDKLWTYITVIEGDGPWPYRMSGYVLHRRDLTDLDEPYRTAVREARAQDHHTG